jgi:hypothetical protein
MSELKGFEEQLASAMKRVDAPRGLSGAVMLAVAREKRRTQPGVLARFFALFAAPAWAMSAVVALLIVGVLGAGQVYEKREHRVIEAQQRAEADREFETADRITDRALDHVRQQLEKVGVQPED